MPTVNDEANTHQAARMIEPVIEWSWKLPSGHGRSGKRSAITAPRWRWVAGELVRNPAAAVTVTVSVESGSAERYRLKVGS